MAGVLHHIILPVLLITMWAVQAEAIGYCPSFCDYAGLYHDARHCHTRPSVYCCGSAIQRRCCSNSSMDIGLHYPERYNCIRNSWIHVHWEVLITMTGSVVLVLLFGACCCQCCRICGEVRAREIDHRVRYTSSTGDAGTIVTDADGNTVILDTDTGEAAEGGETNQISIQLFNPDSPYAFAPPDYSSLPKDPPNYNEVYGAEGGGNLNPCYVPDTPPPAFSEAVASAHEQTHPLTRSQDEERTDENTTDEGGQETTPDGGFAEVDLSNNTDHDTFVPASSLSRTNSRRGQSSHSPQVTSDHSFDPQELPPPYEASALDGATANMAENTTIREGR